MKSRHNENETEERSNSRMEQTDPTRSRSENAETQSEQGNNDLHELLLDELADIMSAEKQLTKALPKMAKAAQSEELRSAFESHLSETENHVSRLEQVFQSIGANAKTKKCKAMEGLIAEGEELMEEMKDTSAIDAALIAAAQKVEHYEMASYGTVCAWAEQMGHDEAVELLEETLEEEKAADEKLTEIAQSTANQEAE